MWSAAQLLMHGEYWVAQIWINLSMSSYVPYITVNFSAKQKVIYNFSGKYLLWTVARYVYMLQITICSIILD